MLKHMMSGMRMLALGLVSDDAFKDMRRGVDPGNGNRRWPRSMYMPHQSKRERRRRFRQIKEGKLRVG